MSALDIDSLLSSAKSTAATLQSNVADYVSTLQTLTASDLAAAGQDFFTAFGTSSYHLPLVFFLGYALVNAHRARVDERIAANSHWLFSLVASAFSCLSGTFVCALLVGGKPKALASYLVVPLFAAMWLFCSFSFINRFLYPYLLKPFALVLYNVYRAHNLVFWTATAAKAFPRSVWGTVFIAIMSIAGSSWFTTALRAVANDLPAYTPLEATRPSAKLRNAFFVAVAYYIAVDPAKHLMGALVPVYMANAAAVLFFQLDGVFDIAGFHDVPFFFPVEYLLCFILGLLPGKSKKEKRKKKEKTH
jgi:hypothetical protein